MATFSNTALLNYAGNTVRSNTVVGTITEPVDGVKRASQPTYAVGDRLTYTVSMRNTGTTDLTGLTLVDDLGTAAYDTQILTPLDYVDGSAQLYINGTPTAATITAGPPLQVTGFTIPAGGNAVLVYNADLNDFAPLDAAGTITNTATISGGTLAAPITLTETVTASTDPRLTIEKLLSPTVVDDDGQLTYTFVIRNYGSRPTEAADNVTLTDTFNPILTNLTVAEGTTMWTLGNQYTYDGGVLTTTPGAITVPAATYTRNADGTVQINPGTVTITATGTV